MSGDGDIVATIIAQQVLVGRMLTFVLSRPHPRHLGQAVVTIRLEAVCRDVDVRLDPAWVAVPQIGIIEIGEFAGVYRDVHFFEGAG